MFGSNVRISPESELGKELAKWNKPYRYEAFPKMLYKARQRPDGVPKVIEVDDKFFGGNGGAAEQWSAQNQKTVGNEDELLKAKGQGWCLHPDEALAQFKSDQDEVANVAANRAYEDRNMGEKARAEVKKLEAETFDHVAEVPRIPIVRGGEPGTLKITGPQTATFSPDKPKVRKQRSDKGQKRVKGA